MARNGLETPFLCLCVLRNRFNDKSTRVFAPPNLFLAGAGVLTAGDGAKITGVCTALVPQSVGICSGG
jgi:hypothetical protein